MTEVLKGCVIGMLGALVALGVLKMAFEFSLTSVGGRCVEAKAYPHGEVQADVHEDGEEGSP